MPDRTLENLPTSFRPQAPNRQQQQQRRQQQPQHKARQRLRSWLFRTSSDAAGTARSQSRPCTQWKGGDLSHIELP